MNLVISLRCNVLSIFATTGAWIHLILIATPTDKKARIPISDSWQKRISITYEKKHHEVVRAKRKRNKGGKQKLVRELILSQEKSIRNVKWRETDHVQRKTAT